jgi:hypothetical protein
LINGLLENKWPCLTNGLLENKWPSATFLLALIGGHLPHASLYLPWAGEKSAHPLLEGALAVGTQRGKPSMLTGRSTDPERAFL